MPARSPSPGATINSVNTLLDTSYSIC